MEQSSVYSNHPTFLNLTANFEEYRAGSDLTQDAENHLPEKPAISSPAEGELDVPLTPWLKASEFSDQDSGDLHAQTQWRIARSNGTQKAANGVIVDLSGPRVLSATNVSILARSNDDQAAAGGNSGSCFIQSLF